MPTHSPCEIWGFWIAAGGWLLCVASLAAFHCPRYADAVVDWIERVLRFPWFLQLLIPAAGAVLMLVGLHLTALGGRGRYPGYPFDIILAWLGS